jgi:small subunit ribosomal protein S6
MARKYEVMFILRPDIAAEEADKVVAGLETTIEKGNGKLVSSEKLGNRKLAYTVRKFNEGSYNLIVLEAEGNLVAELERRLRVTEPVIKFITVRMDEAEKRTEKLRKLRASRVKQSEIEAQAPAQAPAPAAAPTNEPAEGESDSAKPAASAGKAPEDATAAPGEPSEQPA